MTAETQTESTEQSTSVNRKNLKKSVAILRDVADKFEVKLAEHNLARLKNDKPPLHSYDVLSSALTHYIDSGALD